MPDDTSRRTARPFDTHQGSGDRPNLHQLRWLPAAQVAARPPGPRSAAHVGRGFETGRRARCSPGSRAEQRGGRAFASIVRWPGLFIRAPLRRVILAPGQRLTAAAKVARARRSFTPDRTDSTSAERHVSASVSRLRQRARLDRARKRSRQKHHDPKTRRSLRRTLTGRRANRGRVS